MDSGRKVMVIGLDGATFDLIKPWVNEGKLPNLKKLIGEGTYGNLRSTIPSATIPAWPSFFTGCNPGKHGFYDFFKEGKNSYQNDAFLQYFAALLYENTGETNDATVAFRSAYH